MEWSQASLQLHYSSSHRHCLPPSSCPSFLKTLLTSGRVLSPSSADCCYYSSHQSLSRSSYGSVHLHPLPSYSVCLAQYICWMNFKIWTSTVKEENPWLCGFSFHMSHFWRIWLFALETLHAGFSVSCWGAQLVCRTFLLTLDQSTANIWFKYPLSRELP